jgi:radical SAM superfamily enzyme YgiQ (UPF0313 family)
MVNKDLVYIVNAGNDQNKSAIANDYSFPALAPLSLGTWLKNRISDLEVMARDGGVHEQIRIMKEIAKHKPCVVGISVLGTSYFNALQIAKVAKQIGSKVIFGNDHAAQSSKLILENRPDVDYIVGAEYGELPLEMLVKKERGKDIDLADIPSLTYRKGSDIKGFDYQNPAHRKILNLTNPLAGYFTLGDKKASLRNSLDVFPILDRNLYPESHWRKYLGNYLKKFANLHEQEVTGVTTMNRARGCNRKDDAVCKHCDISGVRNGEIAMSSPEMFWEEIRKAHKQIGANSFYEACDSFSSFPRLMKDIAEAKPSNLGFKPDLFVYAQASDLADHPERVQMLKDMGVFRVNVGLESMSDRTLKHMKGTRDSVEKNYRALQLLKDAGIHVYGSFVLGSEAETPRTLAETRDRVIDLIERGYLCDAEAQPILPLYGNYQGRILMKYGLMRIDSKNPDWPLRIDDLSRTYVNRFSGVSYDECVKVANEIRNVARKKGINFGSGAGEISKYS